MSDLKFKGTITQIGEVQSGTSKAGKEWKKVSFLVDNGNEYNNLSQFSLFGIDKVDNFLKYNKEGDTVEVSFNIDCQEYKGKYYTNLSAWKVWGEKTETTPETEPIGEEVEPDELPF